MHPRSLTRLAFLFLLVSGQISLLAARTFPPVFSESDPIIDASFWSLSSKGFLAKYPSFKESSKTSTGLIYKTEDRGQWLGKPAIEVIVYFNDEKPAKIMATYYNKGDTGKIEKKEQRALEEDIEKFLNDQTKITPEKYSDASTPGVRAHGTRWTSSVSRCELRSHEQEFLNVDVYPSEALLATIKGDSKATGTKTDIAKNVMHDENGAVWIANIPMISQGDKGYCTVATIERVMRYYGVDFDQHLIAEQSQTLKGGGTNPEIAMQAARKICNKQNLKLVPLTGSKLSFTKIKELIDEGTPLIWNVDLFLTDEKGLGAGGTGWHTRLIIGYNNTTQEVLFSDSWGNGHEKKVMSEKNAEKIHESAFSIKPNA
jgi:hypothetical protein